MDSLESGQQDVHDVISALRRDLEGIRARRRAKIRHASESEDSAPRQSRARRSHAERMKSLPFAVPAGLAAAGALTGLLGWPRIACLFIAAAVAAVAWYLTEAGPEDADLLRDLAAKVDDLEERSGHLTAGTPEAARRLEEEFRELQVLVESLGQALERQPVEQTGEPLD